MRRRSFILGAVGMAALSPLVYFEFQNKAQELLLGKISKLGPLNRLRRSTKAFGTEVSITVVHHDLVAADNAISLAFKEIELLESLMSLYRTDSQINQLNQEGYLKRPHQYLHDILLAAAQISHETNGAFDVTVQPLWDLYSKHSNTGTLPSSSAVAQAQKLVNWRNLQVSEDLIRLKGQGMAITLNGIAQGFAADLVSKTLQQHDVSAALIDTGEISGLGQKETGQDWQIGIKHPREKEELVLLTKLNGFSLSTSGDYVTRFSDDYKAHHIFNPKTGRSPEELSSVSVLAPSALEADALSTAVAVLGLQEGRKLIESRDDVEAFFITKKAQKFRTPGFPEVTIS